MKRILNPKETCTAAAMTSLEERFRQLQISEESVAKEQMVLNTLSFDSRPMRHELIPEAHQRTFGWVFGNLSDEIEDHHEARHHFASWLESGHGMFWVAGKPGSGKSTFMKFISDDPRTHAMLTNCASLSGTKAVVASHYFWNAGSPMQKSQTGLLRSILFDIFRQSPEIILTVCGDQELQVVNDRKPSLLL